ncbi:MAG: 30S ribosomal protein S16 [bacterium]
MLMIRLSRIGKKKQPTYRLIVSDKRRDTNGKSLEILGQYNPRSNPKTITFKADRIKHWLSKGAQPSPTVHNLLVDQKIIEKQKIKASGGKSKKPAAPAVSEVKPAEVKTA